MLPGTVLAALALIALVPGYTYLRLSEGSREPRTYTALEEFLEVAAVGLATTGLATLIFLLGWPDDLFNITTDALDGDPHAARQAAAIATAIAGTAVGLAFLWAWLTHQLAHGTYGPSVWHSTLGRQRPDRLRHVMIELTNGKTIDGVLHAYTALDGERPRDLALKAPLTVTDGAASWSPDFDYVVVSANQISNVWMVFAADPGQPADQRSRPKSNPRFTRHSRRRSTQPAD